ncbi:hypothetical protein ACGFYF_42235 [Streptomyces lavendulae]|uniref:hypothetical protein n=1 Tax=Streptomyces lavendulae TaxID=1914 RepID=UPI00371644F8
MQDSAVVPSVAEFALHLTPGPHWQFNLALRRSCILLKSWSRTRPALLEEAASNAIKEHLTKFVFKKVSSIEASKYGFTLFV